MESICCTGGAVGNQCLTCGGYKTSDVGHASLVNDLYMLVYDAEDHVFRDAKVELERRLMLLIENVRNGKYDNTI